MQEVNQILKRIEERLVLKEAEAVSAEQQLREWLQKRTQEERERLKVDHEENVFLLKASDAEQFLKALQKQYGGRVTTKTNLFEQYGPTYEGKGSGYNPIRTAYAYTQLRWMEGRRLPFHLGVTSIIRVRLEKDITYYSDYKRGSGYYKISVLGGISQGSISAERNWQPVGGTYDIQLHRQGNDFEITWPTHPTVYHLADGSEERILPHKMSPEELKESIRNAIADTFVWLKGQS